MTLEKNGLYFEEFQAGQRYLTGKRAITEADHVHFTTSFGFVEPLFMDEVYVKTQTPYKGRIVPGALTFSVAEGLTILSGILHKTGMAFLGADMNVLEPVFINDTLTVEIKVVEKRETRKSDRGIVTFLHGVKNQKNQTVMEYSVKRMMRRRP